MTSKNTNPKQNSILKVIDQFLDGKEYFYNSLLTSYSLIILGILS
jgi:hypothetical protein